MKHNETFPFSILKTYAGNYHYAFISKGQDMLSNKHSPHTMVALAQVPTSRACMTLTLQGQFLSYSAWLSCLKIHKTHSLLLSDQRKRILEGHPVEMAYSILEVTPAFCSEYITLSSTSRLHTQSRTHPSEKNETENLVSTREVSLLRLMPPTYACFTPQWF